MGRTLGQQLVIENVAGAGGTLEAPGVATAQPDGYTLLAGSMGHMLTRRFYAEHQV
jgi:tripartite-type tricarboxylate transporter receptor subunit TctC